MRGKCGAQKYQPGKSLGRDERLKYTWHVPAVKQNVGQHPLLLGFAEMRRFYVRQWRGGPAVSIWDVQYLDCCLDFGRCDLVLLNLLIK